MSRRFSLRRNGQECTNLRPLIIFSREEWEDVKHLAAINGCSPEEVVNGFLQNFHTELYERLADHERNSE